MVGECRASTGFGPRRVMYRWRLRGVVSERDVVGFLPLGQCGAIWFPYLFVNLIRYFEKGLDDYLRSLLVGDVEGL